MRIPALLGQLAAAALVALPARAQAGVMPDSLLLPITPAQLLVRAVPGVGASRRVVVPTILFYLSVEGAMRAATTGTRTSSIVNTAYVVAGLEKGLVTEVAQVVEGELASRLRRAGYSVVMLDSLRPNTALDRVARLPVDTTIGAPSVRQTSPRTTFAIVAPSDTQLLAMTDPASRAALAALASELDATVIIPELWFQTPQVERDISLVHGAIRTGTTIAGGIGLIRASMTVITPSGTMGSIALRQPLGGLSDNVGELAYVDSSVTALGRAGMMGVVGVRSDDAGGVIRVGRIARNRTSVNEYELTISPGAYARALLVGTVSFFRAAVEALPRT